VALATIRIIMTAEAASLTGAEFDALFHEVSNWDRWGPDRSSLGTLNYLTPDHVAAAADLVRSGESVSLSLDIGTDARPDNPVPAQHRMTQLPDDESGPEQFIKDFVGTNYHNDGHTHLDALCHVSYHGRLFGGVPDSSATENGAMLGDISSVSNGIVGRGVLLDIPRLHSVPWQQPGDQVSVDELLAAEESQGVKVGPGDLLFVRLGHNQRLATMGSWDTTIAKAGLHPSTARLFSERRIAVLGSDTNSDAAPSTTEGVPFPIHVLAINAMGLYLLDYLQLDDLAGMCERDGRWEFFCVVAPLRMPHATGSPVNPIAVF
jgi:kynurenine formamidase